MDIKTLRLLVMSMADGIFSLMSNLIPQIILWLSNNTALINVALHLNK